MGSPPTKSDFPGVNSAYHYKNYVIVQKIGQARNISNAQLNFNFESQPTFPFPVGGQQEQYP